MKLGTGWLRGTNGSSFDTRKEGCVFHFCGSISHTAVGEMTLLIWKGARYLWSSFQDGFLVFMCHVESMTGSLIL